ncbi:MAG: AraC family transcriptional regulator ligand-binding domain-containing protein [Halopseudomonas sp.]|uniref:AraC family transcriptional regulator n=1 Tax=Halopseudomonas sp. TaxID=2901191 RepID=UPI003002B7A1
MATPLRVTGAWIQLLTDWLDARQLPAPELRLLLDSRAPADLVPMPLWQSMLARAIALQPDEPAAALQIGAQIQPRHIGVLGYLLLACSTLAEGMAAYQRYERLFYGEDLVQLRIDSQAVTLQWPAEASTGELADSVAIAALLSLLRRLLSGAPATAPQQVCFVFAAPAPSAVACYEAFFACPVRFSAACTQVVFAPEVLALPLPRGDAGGRELLDRQAQALMLAQPDADPFARRLQQCMLRLLPEGTLSLARVAAELHTSTRTLQRQLDTRGQSWRQLLDGLRQQLAQQYLADPGLLLTDIALLLGFSEQSVFNRAFRRWYGDTPARTRRKLLLKA